MFISILTCVLVVSLTHAHPLEVGVKNEHKCSKFDYEEKLLEKMIRMEMKMEKILDDVKGKEKDITSIATDLSQRVGNVENNVIQFQSDVNQTVTGFEDRFKKLTELAAETSLPAFNFRLSFSTSHTKTVKHGDKIIFDVEIRSQGKGYDKSTGIFTAPYTGLYFFSVHVCNKDNKRVHYSIVHEGSQLTSSIQHDTNSVYSCSSVSTVVLVRKAERVWVQCLYDSTLFSDSARWSTFTGALLYKHVL